MGRVEEEVVEEEKEFRCSMSIHSMICIKTSAMALNSTLCVTPHLVFRLDGINARFTLCSRQPRQSR